MTNLLYPFIFLSAVGLILSIIAHISALLGIDLGIGSKVFILHIGIFVVWLPTVLVMQKMTKGCKQSDIWKVALIGCPDWMKKVTYGIIGYAIINFVIFMFLVPNHPTNHSGAATPETVRGFSGHWMVFYSVAIAVMYSATKFKDTQRKCQNGHDVSILAKYCDQCGAPIAMMGKNS